MSYIVALALVGAVTHLTLNFLQPRRSKVGWDYLLMAGLYGGVSFGIARLLFAFSYFFCPELVRGLKGWLDGLLTPHRFIGTYILSFLVAPFLGYALHRASVIARRKPLSRFLKDRIGFKRLPGERGPLESFNTPRGLYICSTDRDQVYIGFLVNITSDPDATDRIVEMNLLLSGRRLTDEDTKRGKVQYHYATRPGKQRLIYLDFRNVVSIADFEFWSFVETVEAGYSLIDDSHYDTFADNLRANGILSETEVRNNGLLRELQKAAKKYAQGTKKRPRQ